jgi:hypothetical protein
MIEALTSPGHEVPGIDFDEELRQEHSGELPDAQPVSADASEKPVSRDLDFGDAAIGRWKGDRQCGR